ncbi:MAG: hypothetical protein WBE76_18335, partial [Terracidiphilus sp.]
LLLHIPHTARDVEGQGISNPQGLSYRSLVRGLIERQLLRTGQSTFPDRIPLETSTRVNKQSLQAAWAFMRSDRLSRQYRAEWRV